MRRTVLYCTIRLQYTEQNTTLYIQGFGSRTGRIQCFCLLWILIRIRFSNFSGSGPGFNPDPGTKKECRKGSKSELSEENLKIMTKDRQKLKKATIFKTEVSDPDPVLKNS